MGFDVKIVVVKKQNLGGDSEYSLVDDPLSVSFRCHLDQLHDAAAEHQRCVDALRTGLLHRSIEVVECELIEGWYEKLLNEGDVSLDGPHLFMSVGGDGSFLQVASAVRHGVVTGIKSTSYSVGSLCAATEHTMMVLIDEFLSGAHQPIQVCRVAARVTSLCEGSSAQVSSLAFNDVLYTNSHPGSAVRYLYEWQDRLQKQTSSGVWIYTHQGATAAAQAAGAKMVVNQFGFIIREPYGSYQWNSVDHQNGFDQQLIRSADVIEGCFEDSSSPTFVNLSQNAQLVIDGHQSLSLKPGDKITFYAGKSCSWLSRS